MTKTPHVIAAFTAGFLTAVLIVAYVFAMATGAISIPSDKEFGSDSNMNYTAYASFKASPVKYIASSVDSAIRFAKKSDGGKIERVRYDDSTSAWVEKCPMTATEQAEFGHIPCELETPEMFKMEGIVNVGLARYTWSDDSILDLTALAAIYSLHVEDGVYKDSEGFVACYSRTNPLYEEIETPLGPGKIYDYGSDWYTIGIFLSRNLLAENS